ncbi:MAG: hypothetical protein J5857_04675 [Treponema sp.]|nr:hypothetical protein [Treponema sp.]
MKKLANFLFNFIISAIFFSSCEFWQQPVREYLEYWTTTCQVGRIEYLTPYTELDGSPNLSALNPVEIDIYLINPKGYPILCKSSDTQKCFKFTDESKRSNFYTDYSETALDHNTTIKIRATLPDDTEGQKITLSGCIWPENRSNDWSETDLKESFPELFYETTFVQNTPPDNVKNVNTLERVTFGNTGKHYLTFSIPDQRLKRNSGSRYEIKYWERDERDDSLTYQGSKILSLSDDRDPSTQDVFEYYFDEQEEALYYEYTVQVLGPHGLKSEIFATPKGPGVHQLMEPTLTILNAFNGLEDEDEFKCIEVATNDDVVTFTSAPADPSETLTVKVDDEVVTASNYTVSRIGQHTIKSTSSKDGSRPITVIKKIRIVKTPDPATFTFGTNETDTYFNDMTDTNGYEYLEVPQLTSTVDYTISPTEEGTTVSGTVDGTGFDETEESKTGALNVNAHTLTAVIHKQYCNDVTTTRKIMVAKTLEAPVYEFTQKTNDQMVGEVEYIEVSSSTAKAGYTIKPITADSGACVSSTAGSIQFDATPQKSGELAVNDYTFTVTVSKDYMIPRTFTKKVKVDSVLTKPEIKFGTDFNGKKDAMNYRYIEVDSASSIVTYTVTNKDSRGGTLSTVVTNMANSPNTTVSTNDSGELGVGKYKVEATVKKDGYTDVIAREFIVIVPKLKEPTITFGKDFNGKGADTDGYLYIEVPNTSSTVSYTSSSPDTGVTVTTKINNWAKNNSGDLIIGDHEIVVTVTKAFQIDATITKKVKVVQELQEPAYSFTPGLTGSVTDGFEWIEVPDGTTPVTYTITAASGCSMTIKNSYNNSTSNVSGNTHVNNLVSLGSYDTYRNYTLTVTVKKPFYNDKTFYKYIKVVKALQEPEIYIKNGTQRVNNTNDAEDTNWSEYECYNINLAADGTGSLRYETQSDGSGATITISDRGNSIDSSSGTLALGPHSFEIRVTKDKYKPKIFFRNIYIQGILAEASVSSSNGTFKGGTGISSSNALKYQFNYLRDDKLKCSITPGNTGNTVTLKYGNSSLNPSNFEFVPDNTYVIRYSQSRQYCKSTPEVSKYIRVDIKPVTVTIREAALSVNFDDAGSTEEIYGKVYLRYNNEDWIMIREFNNAEFAECRYDSYGITNNPTFTLTKPSDTVSYKSDGLYEKDSGSNKDWIPNVEVSKSLSELKTETDPQLYAKSSGNHDTDHWIKLSLSSN